jgi:excisionase family DNA binding protein
VPKQQPNSSSDNYATAFHQHSLTDKLLTTKEVARITGLSTSTFEKARLKSRGNGLPWYKIGGCIRYRRSEVEAWLDSGRVSGGTCNV